MAEENAASDNKSLGRAPGETATSPTEEFVMGTWGEAGISPICYPEGLEIDMDAETDDQNGIGIQTSDVADQAPEDTTTNKNMGQARVAEHSEVPDQATVTSTTNKSMDE